MSNIRRYMMQLSYLGSQYRGSQMHCTHNIIDADSIQGSLESVMTKLNPLLINPPSVHLAGRTDSGVHALCTTAHFDLEFKYKEPTFCPDEFVQSMNRHLVYCNHEIRILSCREVGMNFHARFRAISRTYLYRFLVPKDKNNKKMPITEFKRSMHVNLTTGDFNIDKFRRGVELFRRKWDFRTFCAAGGKKDEEKVYVRTVDINLEEASPLLPFDPLSADYNYWHIIIKSKSFLYNQIRRMVGALVGLAIGRITEEDFMTMLQVPSHRNYHTNISLVPPYGLYLLNVEYDEADIQKIHENS